MLSRQAIYDRIKQHLLSQDGEAFHTSGNCAYHADDGKKCAVGCLIPDDKYQPSFEGLPYTGPEIKPILEEVIGRPLQEDDNKLLDALMYCHDNIRVALWDKELYAIASRQGLQP